MDIVCLDLEGVLVPEIWIEFAHKTGIKEFTITTRDEPDYDKLMHYRIDLLEKHKLTIHEITDVIKCIEPLIGAHEFLDKLRERAQVLILSDTFDQFGRPLMRKLNWPSLFCNSLFTDERGKVTGYKLRCPHTKLTTVKALQSCGFETICAGDSYNDLEMIRASKAGFLFRSTEEIKKNNPDIPSFENYDEFLKGIFNALG